MERLARLAAAAALTLILPAAAHAQQLIAWPIGQRPWQHLLPGRPVRPVPLPQPGPRPENPETVPVAVSGYEVTGTIEDQAADLTYRVTFRNRTDRRLEGVLLVPLPADAVLGGFTMTVGGKEMKGELLDSGQAATIYENIVRQARDPGLLELVGERLFRARVFPIEPRSDVAVRLTLTQTLRKDGGLASVRVPLASARMLQAERGGAASVRLSLRTNRPLRTVYSPHPRAAIARDGDRAATIALRGEPSRDEADLDLFFSTQDDPLSAGLLTFKETGEDGYFMLSLSPRAADAEARAMPKDVVFVVDRSGSMSGAKMEQTRQALAYCIGRLSPRDRFGVVDFATDWNALDSRLIAADEAGKARGLRYVERLEAAGGTNIGAGLSEGLKLLAPAEGRVPMLFFLTDGLPTVGQTDPAQLLREAQAANGALKARLFTFGVGSDVNTLFLDKLAQEGRGAGDYVQPNESIEAKVSTLYQKIARPALTDVRLSWEGLDVIEVFPRPVADLFHGSQLVVLGRYKGEGRGRLVVTGRSGDRAERFEFPVELPRESTRLAFLPRLWANAKVAHELDAVRLSGRADPEVIAGIVALAKKHGIVTPYTSYLVLEEGMDLSQANAAAIQAVRGAAQDALVSGGAGFGAASARAQRVSVRMTKAKAAASPGEAMAAMDAFAKEARLEAAASGRRAAEIRVSGGKAFYRRGGVWIDGDFEIAGAKAAVVELEYLSEAYFEALRRTPALARWFAVGAPVTVLHNGTAYKVAVR